jgi:hypothetical protein
MAGTASSMPAEGGPRGTVAGLIVPAPKEGSRVSCFIT